RLNAVSSPEPVRHGSRCFGPTSRLSQQEQRREGRRQTQQGGDYMASFDDREKAHEAKFARDGELRFKAEARRNKLLGLWAAEHMGLSEEHAKEYAAEVV